MSHPSDAADDPAAADRDRTSDEGRYADLDAGPDDDTDASPFDPAAIGDRERAEIEDTIFEMRSAAARLEEVLLGGKRVLTRREVAQLAEVSTI